MWTMVKFEYRKLWNRVSLVAVIVMCIISTFHTFVYLNMNGQWRAISTEGEIVSGLSAYRVLKDASKDIEGVADDTYLQKLKKQYENSVDKQYLDEHRGFLGTGGMTKYMYPNYFINYAYYSYYMSNGNDKMGLAYDFLDSAEKFYQKYREAVKEQILYENQYAGLMKFTDSQIEALDQKITEMDTPVHIAYCQGISNFMNWYDIEYPLFFVVYAFALSCVYAKDSPSGINELTLSSAKGRKKDFRARWTAGNLFAASTYLLFVSVLLIEHGAVGTFGGFGASAQTYWFNCIFNISIGAGMMFKIVGGLCGTLVFANFTMLLSCLFRNSKIAAVFSTVMAGTLVKLSDTYCQIKLLYPNQFSSDAAVHSFFFLGRIIVPYMIVVLFLAVAYIGIFTYLLGRKDKKYFIN